jgi:hypothetical protein
MNKEQIFDEVYEKYADSHWISPSNPKGKLLSDQLFSVIPMEHSKETFINECKRNNKFSKKWGLKIEERELDMFERWELANLTPNMSEIDYCNKLCDKHNVPTKLITITYKDTIIESYENNS